MHFESVAFIEFNKKIPEWALHNFNKIFYSNYSTDFFILKNPNCVLHFAI